jgi:hypothetical protein
MKDNITGQWKFVHVMHVHGTMLPKCYLRCMYLILHQNPLQGHTDRLMVDYFYYIDIVSVIDSIRIDKLTSIS